MTLLLLALLLTPTELRTVPQSTTIVLAWDASIGPDLAGHVVHYGTESKLYSVAVDVGKNTTWTHQAPIAGRTYYYAVHAYNTVGGISDNSAEVFGSVGVPLPVGDTTPPSSPTNIVPSLITSTSLVLSWTASTDNVGVVNYIIDWNGSYLATRTGLGIEIWGIPCGVDHTFTVRALDAANNPSVPASIVVKTLACVVTPPPPPPPGDTTGPVVSFPSAPVRSGQSSNYTITVAAIDPSGVQRVEVFVDNRSVGNAVLVSPGRYSARATVTTSGNHTAKAIAYDTKGNASLPVLRTFTR
jgi:hypothetical protein